MEIDLSTAASVALGVFLALAVRDILRFALGVTLGIGVVSSSRESVTKTVHQKAVPENQSLGS